MPLPKFTPLQSRFAASLGVTVVMFIVYYCLSQPSLAYAAELNAANSPILHEPFLEQRDRNGVSLVERQDTGSRIELFNNQPRAMNIEGGQTQFWFFSQESIDGPSGTQGVGLPSPTGVNSSLTPADGSIDGDEENDTSVAKRQSGVPVYITVTTCTQPSYNGSSPDSDDAIPPQLTLYASYSDQEQQPGPGTTSQVRDTLEGGYAVIQLDGTSAISLGVAAPNGTSFLGGWNYQIAASIDAPFHTSVTTTPKLHFVDADTRAALLITDDLTSAESNETAFAEWMEMTPPYGMFVYPADNKAMEGIRNSYCGLRMGGGLLANLENDVNQNVAGMTSRGIGGKPKEQFYITGLNSSSRYTGFLAMQGNSTASGNDVINGGGTVWQAVQFNTKSMPNCALMYNLTFCSEVAYAVPTNPERFSTLDGLPELARIYDNYAQQMYQYFNYSLQQIPCNASSTSAYSLVRNCDDCARAYKTWLCAVSIPRCEDFNNTAVYLKMRNAGQPFPNGSSLDSLPAFSGSQQTLMETVDTNVSRSAVIDDQIAPGPYKEVLPCRDLCYDLVQSCPSALGFGCPHAGKGLENSYGVRSDDPGNISCSYLGAAYFLSGSSMVCIDSSLLSIWTLAVMMFMAF
jgi:calcium channel MID1